MLHLHYSNRLESLAGLLAEIVRETPRSPNAPAGDVTGALRKEVICVPSRSLQTWIALQVAEKNTVVANVAFVSPRSLLEKVVAAIAMGCHGDEPAAPALDPLEQSICVWRIVRLLPSLMARYPDDFAAVRNYLAPPHEGLLPRYLLAREIARVFSDYLLYRPELITAWSKKLPLPEECRWQARLIQEVLREAKTPTLAQQLLHLSDMMNSTRLSAATGIPSRLSVFGFSHLPPLFLYALYLIARHTDIHLFTLNPSADFWFDCPPERREERAAVLLPHLFDNGDDPTNAANVVASDGHTGNRLLSLWGGLMRDFWRLLADIPTVENELFVPVARTSLLANVQADILENANGGEAETQVALPAEKFPSLRVVSCHSERRELEELQDFLLGAFANDPQLLPKDILIMAPNIAAYAPLVPLVFATPGLPHRVIGTHHASEHANAFFAMIDTARGKLTANAVISLLETPLIQEANGWKSHEVSGTVQILKEANIRWGVDAADRARHDLPAFEQNSWRQGLQRLVLGYALRPHTDFGENPAGDFLFQGIAPVEGIEGDIADTLGKLVVFSDKLMALRTTLQKELPPAAWRAEISTHLQELLRGSDALIRSSLADWEEETAAAGFTDFVPFDVLREYLQAKLSPEEHREFISGAITFCSLLPLRPVPFKIIGLLGMNCDSFPRREMRAGFNLIATRHRLGDKTRRNEDMHLFLETLLNARNSLYLSYIGQSIKDNRTFPPSVLVADLLDYLDGNYEFSGDPPRRCRDVVWERQPLQGFSRSLFDAVSPRSYSEINLACARALEKPPEAGYQAPTSLLAGITLEPPAAPQDVAIPLLISFFKNPSRFFLERCLDARFPQRQEGIADDEPTALDGLARFDLGTRLLRMATLTSPHAATAAEWLAPIRAQGILPVGAPGELAWDRIVRDTARVAAANYDIIPQGFLPPLEVSLTVAGTTIRGQISEIGKTSLTRCRFAKFRIRHLLELWIEHLLLNAVAAADYPRVSHIVCRDRSVSLGAVADPLPPISRLLRVFSHGLTAPLPFFPETSWAFFKARQTGAGIKAALLSARARWNGGFSTEGERMDTHISACFGANFSLEQFLAAETRTGVIPLVEAFAATAEEILADMAAHIDGKSLP